MTIDMELPQIHRTFDASSMGPGNIHASDQEARRVGLPGAIVQGGQLTSLLINMLLRKFGCGYLSGGELDVGFRAPVKSGDAVVAGGRIIRVEVADGDTRMCHCEVWLKNQDGQEVVTGTAIGLLYPSHEGETS